MKNKAQKNRERTPESKTRKTLQKVLMKLVWIKSHDTDRYSNSCRNNDHGGELAHTFPLFCKMKKSWKISLYTLSLSLAPKHSCPPDSVYSRICRSELQRFPREIRGPNTIAPSIAGSRTIPFGVYIPCHMRGVLCRLHGFWTFLRTFRVL